MILNDFIEPKIKFSNDKLDAVLAELCGLILTGQRVNPKLNGKVAAAVLDPMGKLVTGVNYLHGDKRVHAENAAIENYEQEYGKLPKGCIIITTLSPCNESNDKTAEERYGESCTDLLNSCNIKMAYCGYEDYTQDDIKNNFTVVVTSNEKIKELCKRIADTFLKNLEETTITTNEAIDPAILDLAAARMGYRNHLAVPQRQLPTLYKLASTTELSTPTSNELRRYQKALDQRKRNQQAVDFTASHWDPDEEMTEDNGKTKAENFIHQVYSQYPEWPYGQADRVMVWGDGEEQEFAAFKLKPGAGDNTVSIDWIMAGPEQRKGVGTRAIQELQRLAQKAGVKLTLYPWGKGQISQASLKRFYKRQGFQPVAKGAAPMQWDPDIKENTNRQILSYIRKIHPKGEFRIDHAVMNHAEWTLTNVPLSSLHIEPDDISPYDQINYIDYNHVGKITAQDIKNKPIVVDNDGWIIDGNHRAVAAREMGMIKIPAYVPVEDEDELQEHNNVEDEINYLLRTLTPDDVGVEEFDGYRVHFEGFTDDCKTSSDYQRNPKAVYQEVFNDFIRREGGAKPIKQGFTGSEDNPVLYSIFKTQINELKIDNSNGIGAVPHNKDVDYFGLRVKMRPSKFLELAKPMPMSADDKETIQHLEKEKDSRGFGAPFLTLNMEGEFPRVEGHDGRHRMTAIRNTEGDIPVEVHIFPRYMRNKDLTPELIDKMNSLIISETGRYVVGPIFSQAVKEAINEFAPTPSNDDDGDVPPNIYTLANRWWNNTDDQDRIANVLRSMGWDIQQSDGEEDVCQLTYRDGSVYYLHDSEFDPDLYENFADGKHPGRKGLSKRMGVNTKASVSSLRKTAKHSSGEKARMAHWLANMKSGREKAKKK